MPIKLKKLLYQEVIACVFTYVDS